MGKVAWFKTVLTDSRKPTAVTNRGRFCDQNGDQQTVAATRAFGITQDTVDATGITDGRKVTVTILGIEELEVGAATAIGPLTNDNTGRGVNATAGQPVNGYGLEAGTAAGDRVPCLFIGFRDRVASAANPDTSAATLANLEIEVNELKAALRAHGILAP